MLIKTPLWQKRKFSENKIIQAGCTLPCSGRSMLFKRQDILMQQMVLEWLYLLYQDDATWSLSSTDLNFLLCYQFNYNNLTISDACQLKWIEFCILKKSKIILKWQSIRQYGWNRYIFCIPNDCIILILLKAYILLEHSFLWFISNESCKCRNLFKTSNV